MAIGRVATGFSLPYVALYNANEGVITYTNGQKLARGVSVTVEVEASENNNFYADNQTAETAPGTFTSGTVTYTLDGLKRPATKLIFGLDDPDADGFVAFGDNMQIPYVATGYITRYISSGVTCYVPTIHPKVSFAVPSHEAATQEEEIDWQTQELTGTLMRDDSPGHVWKYEGNEYLTEAEAEAALKKFLGIEDAPAVTYTITAAAATNGSVSVDKTEAEEGDTVTVTATPDSEYLIDTITYTPEGGSAADITATGSFAMPAANVTVNATFKIKTYTVTFDSDGGTAVEAQTVNSGEKATEPAQPTKDSATFVEWQKDGTAYNFDDPVTADITLTATWS